MYTHLSLTSLKIFFWSGSRKQGGLFVSFGGQLFANNEHLQGCKRPSQRCDEHLQGEKRSSQRCDEHLQGRKCSSQRCDEHLQGRKRSSQRCGGHL
ncbi:MAG: hypothetical protein LBS63_04825 [Prevotellaceae bacterium]|nr:hypothetical protein [Prevotellaceae bacterium]